MDHSMTSRTERIEVEVDSGYRVVRVVLNDADDSLRRPDALSAAFDDAYTRALLGEAARQDALADRPAPSGERRAAGPVLRERPAAPTPHHEPRWDLINAVSGADLDGGTLQPVGSSDNDCVHVRLDPGSSRGHLVDVDPGWLRQATVANLTAAIQQAFAHAYEKRDRS
jgi:hypothetical protein